MEARELLGYFLFLLVACGMVAAVWAARYYTPGRVYARLRTEELRQRRGATPAE